MIFSNHCTSSSRPLARDERPELRISTQGLLSRLHIFFTQMQASWLTQSTGHITASALESN